jgi:hypothetical protein
MQSILGLWYVPALSRPNGSRVDSLGRQLWECVLFSNQADVQLQLTQLASVAEVQSQSSVYLPVLFLDFRGPTLVVSILSDFRCLKW